MILTREVKGLAEYDLEAPEMRFPASILKSNRLTDQELFQIVTDKFAREASALNIADIYFFPAEISNQNLDSYYTKMAESSLRNYSEDSNSGVAFQNSHKSRELGVGYVIHGEYIEQDKRVLADIYTVRGIKLNADLDTDNFIKGIEAGLIRDVSIGFKSGPGYKETCNLCGESYWSYDCRHIAGMMYEMADDPTADPTNQNTNEQMAFVWIENARLSEVSAVYDGATPDAMILTKARREQRAGRLSGRLQTEIQKRFHIDLHEPRKTFGGSEQRMDEKENERPILEDSQFEERSETNMTDLEKAQQAQIDAQAKTTLAEGRAVEAESKLTTAETRATTAEARVTELEAEIRAGADGIDGLEIAADAKAEDVVRSIRSHVDKIAPMAKQADGFRSSAIDEAVKSGIRLFGDAFDEEKRRATLSKLELSEIQETAFDWDTRATEKFGKPRTSKEEGEANPDETTPTNSRIDPSIPTSSFNSL